MARLVRAIAAGASDSRISAASYRLRPMSRTDTRITHIRKHELLILCARIGYNP